MTEDEIQKINKFCERYQIMNYTINDDELSDDYGSIDVDGTVYLVRIGITKFPIKFNKVTGDFNCYSSGLTTLEGSPKYVGGNFDCTSNKIYTLEGFNSEIVDFFYCYDNPIENLINNGVDSDFIKAFNAFKVVKDKVVNLKRLKYVMSIFGEPVYLDLIKKHYTIV